MAITIDIHEAAERLEEFVERACAGEDVAISINGVPMVWIRPYDEAQPTGTAEA